VFKRAFGKLLAGSMVLSGCAQLALADDDLQVPCWFNQPAQSGQVGAIGLARDLDVGSGKPVQFSRHRALSSIASYLGAAEIPEQRAVDIQENTYQLAGQTVRFAEEFSYQGYVYSYAGLNHIPSANHCSLGQCALDRCTPAWLCEPGLDEQPSLLGTSYRSSSLPAQYRVAIDNAIKQIAPIYGLSVTANDRFYTSFSSMGSIRILLSDEKIDPHKNAQVSSLRYIVTDSCLQNEQLFLRVNFPDLPALSNVPAETWLTDPSTADFDGAIGSVNGRVASGLLSDKVELAIKRGLIELAKSKNSSVAEELISIERKDNLYQVSIITQDTAVSLQARVNGMHFAEGQAGIDVYAWLVQTQGETP